MSGDTRGFSVFALDHPHAVRTFRMKLERIKSDRLNELVVAQDWPDFKRRIGIIQGLDEALQVCDDIEKAERA